MRRIAIGQAPICPACRQPVRFHKFLLAYLHEHATDEEACPGSQGGASLGVIEVPEWVRPERMIEEEGR